MRRRRSCSTRSAACARSGAPAATSSIRYLSPPDIVPTLMHAGEWRSRTRRAATSRAPCCSRPPSRTPRLRLARARRGVRGAIARACAADPWLAEHPPSFAWAADIPPMEIPSYDPIVATVLAASADVGEPSRLSGLDSWYDGATYTLSAGTPSIGFGPRSIAVGAHDRRVRAGRRPRALRARDRAVRRALLRDAHEHAHPARGAARPGHPGARSRVDARGPADRARPPPGRRPRRPRRGPAPAPDAHRGEPVPARPADRRALGGAARPPLETDPRLAEFASTLPSPWTLAEADELQAVRRHLASRRRRVGRRDHRQPSSSASARRQRSTPGPTRSRCWSATAARRWASSAGR